MPEVLVEHLQRDRLQRLGGGRDLGEDVDAVAILVDHRLEAPDLAFDATQPLLDGVLVVAFCWVVALGLIDLPVGPRRPRPWPVSRKRHHHHLVDEGAIVGHDEGDLSSGHRGGGRSHCRHHRGLAHHRVAGIGDSDVHGGAWKVRRRARDGAVGAIDR